MRAEIRRGSSVPIPAGEFLMGSERFYPDEGPVHRVRVAEFDLDRHPVTNLQFASFVRDTGYTTLAERQLDPSGFPGREPEGLARGGRVFARTSGPVDPGAWRAWWAWSAAANWQHPYGLESTILDKPDHPVVQVAYEDAVAYAAWAGRRLPTEPEWEYAAHGGEPDTFAYAWGNQPRAGGRLMANTWQGRFPYENTGADGWVGTSPVGRFPENGYGLVDMIGNVWEWTSSRYAPRHDADPGPDVRLVLKGGSHLCAPEYCHRFRPAARSPQSAHTATTHIGFRCAGPV